MTKDNISVTVDAVVFMKIVNTKDSVVNIRNVWDSVMKMAQTTMRDVVGDVELDELLARRDEVATKIANIIDRETADWGGRHHFSEPPNCRIARRHETRNRKTSRS
jgi:regulator of protease activity HflC (stomatin/prohibitin superfamily)